MKTFAIKIIGCVYIKADTQEKAAEKLFQGLNCLPPEIYDFEYGTGIDGWEEIQEGKFYNYSKKKCRVYPYFLSQTYKVQILFDFSIIIQYNINKEKR